MTDGEKKRNPLRMSTAGIEFAGVFGFFLVMGYLADSLGGKLFETYQIYPTLTIIGAIAGFFSALYRLLKQARSVQNHQDEPPDPSNKT